MRKPKYRVCVLNKHPGVNECSDPISKGKARSYARRMRKKGYKVTVKKV